MKGIAFYCLTTFLFVGTLYAQVPTAPTEEEQKIIDASKQLKGSISTMINSQNVEILSGNAEFPNWISNGYKVWNKINETCRIFVEDQKVQDKITREGSIIQVDLEKFGFSYLKIDGKIRYLIHSDDIKKFSSVDASGRLFTGCQRFGEGVNLFGNVVLFYADKRKAYENYSEHPEDKIRYYPFVYLDHTPVKESNNGAATLWGRYKLDTNGVEVLLSADVYTYENKNITPITYLGWGAGENTIIIPEIKILPPPTPVEVPTGVKAD